MARFLIKKHYTLEYLGEGWKDAYIDFTAFSVSDIKNKLSKLTGLDAKNTDSVTGALDMMVELLEDKFIGGKVPTNDPNEDKSNLVGMTKEDIKELPVEVISKAVSFLSQGLNQ